MQMEFSLAPSQNTLTGIRRHRTQYRARWWFDQMRDAANSAIKTEESQGSRFVTLRNQPEHSEHRMRD